MDDGEYQLAINTIQTLLLDASLGWSEKKLAQLGSSVDS